MPNHIEQPTDSQPLSDIADQLVADQLDHEPFPYIESEDGERFAPPPRPPEYTEPEVSVERQFKLHFTANLALAILGDFEYPDIDTLTGDDTRGAWYRALQSTDLILAELNRWDEAKRSHHQYMSAFTAANTRIYVRYVMASSLIDMKRTVLRPNSVYFWQIAVVAAHTLYAWYDTQAFRGLREHEIETGSLDARSLLLPDDTEDV